VCHVRRLLDTIGDALADSRLDPLLTAEPDLEAALQALASVQTPDLDAAARMVVRAEIQRCRLALDRCRRLGASLGCFTAMMLQDAGGAAFYTRAGEGPAAPAPRTLQAKG
jgi:hypothetical protein